MENVVAAVEDNSPAAKAGLQPGDRITSVQFLAPAKDEAQASARKSGEPVELNAEQQNWYYVHAAMQVAKPGTQVALTYVRKGDKPDAKRSATLESVPSDRWFYPWRGLILTGLTQVRTAESWGEACRLGLRETREKVVEVGQVLHRLVTGRISMKNLGGPIMIMVAAGSEASKGIPSLLVFLTFLSANLAVLNILPIPVLDGGHLMFLAAEGIRRKPVDERLQLWLTLIGFALLVALMIYVFWLDICRLLGLSI